jgi:hypothetical protein
MAKTCCKNHFFPAADTTRPPSWARGVSSRKKIFYNMVTKLCRASAIEE